jgi:AcrR family transcriptional regulator
MKRPSRGEAQRRLLDVARAMLPETGISGLRLREVARRAGVNLGLFHYHFGSKEAFTRRLLQELYEEFFAELSLESSGAGSPLERLRRSLIAFGRFIRQHRQFIMMIIQEVLQGDRDCVDFARKNIPRHVSVIAGLIEEGRKAGEIKPIPLPMAMAFAMGGVGVPNLMITMLERVGARRAFDLSPKDLEFLMLSDEALAQRAELIVSVLAVGGGR